MTLSPLRPQHPLLAACAVIDEALDQTSGVDPLYAPTGVKAEALTALAQIVARVEALRLQVLATADDVAEQHGARSAAAWWGHATRADAASAAADGRLAARLESTSARTGAALRDGAVSVDQARAIVWGLDRLPDNLAPEIRSKAEAYLLDHARDLTPRELRKLSRGLLAHLAPDVADAHERKLLDDEEARAATETRLSIRRRGDGTSDIHARVPDPIAARLERYLHAFTNPRRDHQESGASSGDPSPFLRSGRVDPATGERLSYARLLGDALGTLLESLPAQLLPTHGGTATQVIVTIDQQTLTGQLHAAGMLDDGTPITAGHARRLACQAGILPAVLGSTSDVLDLGRSQRLHSPAQRKAHALKHSTCQAAGCQTPWTWCESHHPHAWSDGGGTDLANLEFLCPYHHHRVHDPTYVVERHPDDSLTFRRRR